MNRESYLKTGFYNHNVIKNKIYKPNTYFVIIIMMP